MTFSRKEFLVTLTRGGVVLGTSTLLSAFLESCSNPTGSQETPLPTVTGIRNGNTLTVDISSGTTLAQSGIGIIQYQGGSMLVDRTQDGIYHALSPICTHQGCTINQYNTSSKEFICPCHGSRFNSTGGVTNGPAQSPLKQYSATINGNQLIITLG